MLGGSFRQNKTERRLRKRWSHIPSDFISLLDNDKLNVISLKVQET